MPIGAHIAGRLYILTTLLSCWKWPVELCIFSRERRKPYNHNSRTPHRIKRHLRRAVNSTSRQASIPTSLRIKRVSASAKKNHGINRTETGYEIGRLALLSFSFPLFLSMTQHSFPDLATPGSTSMLPPQSQGQSFPQMAQSPGPRNGAMYRR